MKEFMGRGGVNELLRTVPAHRTAHVCHLLYMFFLHFIIFLSNTLSLDVLQVPPENRFTPIMLFNSMKQHKVQSVLISVD